MKKSIVLLLLILFAGSLVRFYKFSAPIADWHSWRQVDTSSVSRIFVQKGFDLLHPRFHDVSNVPSGKDNPEGYRFVEFPLYNLLQGGLFVLFDSLTLEQWGRLVTIFASMSSTLLLYGVLSRHTAKVTALLSSGFFALMPYSIYFGRVTLPDPLMVSASLVAIFFFNLWTDTFGGKYMTKHAVWFLLSMLFAASALLLKPFAIFFLLPIVFLAYQTFGLSMVRKWQLYVFALVAVVPLLWWRNWMLQFPEGIPVNEWLFNGGNIRFKGAFFYWIFADRIGRLMLGYFGIALFILGILALFSKFFLKSKKDLLFLLSFPLASLLYVIVVARGNVQHDYYQIPIIPSIAILLGFGATFLLRPINSLHKYASMTLFVLCTVGMFLFGWYHVRDFFNINNPNIIVAGEMVDKLTPKDAKVIAFYEGDTTFLYQTKRMGWASLEKPLPEMIEMGAEYLAIVNPTQQDIDGLGKEYPVVASDPRYLILKLQE
ncbi:MAG: glycosyltransferase family 39 protein [Candidatus Levybacteria bacterium]|nr:glycosyltransferase family 39 protein [Candidatus Levybacteria bacterium]